MARNFYLPPGGRLKTTALFPFRRLLTPAALGILVLFLMAAPPAFADGGAVMSVVPDSTGFYCGTSMDVTFGYIPDAVDTPVLRGYSVRVVAEYGLTFDEGDIMVNSPLAGVNDTYLIIENGVADYTIDFTFLDPGAGLAEAADLFVITFKDSGFNIPTFVSIDSGRFRNPENQVIPVDVSATAPLLVACYKPTNTTIAPEPEYTPGTTNTLSWTDEAWAGAVEYNCQMSIDPEFGSIDDESGWITGLSHEFTGLLDTQQYYFKAFARNFTGLISNPSNIEQSIQDAASPITSIDPLDAVQYTLEFDLDFQAIDVTSGFDQLELFYRYDSGAWTSFGTHTLSPIVFTAPEGDGLYEFYTVGVDIAGNTESTPAGPYAETTRDTSAPYGGFTINNDATATNTPGVVLFNAVLRADEMRFSNNGIDWPEGWVSYNNIHLWTIPDTEGLHTVYGEFRDAVMQVIQDDDSIEFDVTPTGPVTEANAAPGHEAVLLNWTNPGDADFHAVEIWRAVLHDGSFASTYPSYIGSTVPAPPLDRAAAQASLEWTLAGLSEVGATAFVDSVTERGVYYYELFATDPAGNYSVPHGVLPRATNYVLGDVALPHDGRVTVEDVTLLGKTFGIVGFDPLFVGVCDVGPTDDATGTGIPLPDDVIDLDDEMIFGMNYLPSAKNGPGDTTAPATPGAVSLSWKPVDDHTWTLDLTSFSPQLKGLGLSVDLPAGMKPVVSAGDAVLALNDPYLLLNNDQHGLDAGLVVLGRGRGVTTTGTLLTVSVPTSSEGGQALIEAIHLDLRDVDNKPLAFDLLGKSTGTPAAVFSLGEAYPNPFNPTTTIRFSIPGEMPVRLEIYGMDGRRVAVLVDETLAGGPHEEVWLGRDDSGRQVASGVYFSRLLAGSQSRVRKMTLMK